MNKGDEILANTNSLAITAKHNCSMKRIYKKFETELGFLLLLLQEVRTSYDPLSLVLYLVLHVHT